MSSAASIRTGFLRAYCAGVLACCLAVVATAGGPRPHAIDRVRSRPLPPDFVLPDVPDVPPPASLPSKPDFDPSLYEPEPLPFVSESEFEAHRGPLGQLVRYNLRTGVEEVVDASSVPPSILAIERILGGTGMRTGHDESRYRNFTELEAVEDPDLFPWCVNCKLFYYKGGSQRTASGVLIDPQFVLTAGHCVHEGDGGEWVTDMEVIPGYHNGNRPYGDAEGIELYSWLGWTRDGEFNHDMGVIRLDYPIGAICGWFGYGSCTCGYFTSSTFHNPGYPAADPYNGCCMYYWYGDYDFCFDYQVGYFRDAYGGQSGSGSYHIHDDLGRIVYAELSNSFEIGTRHVKITSNKFHSIYGEIISPVVPTEADLRPLNADTMSSPVYAGESISDFSFLILNYSTETWDNFTTCEIYLSTDPEINATDHLLASEYIYHDIPAYGRVEVSASPFQIPDYIQPRTYYLGVKLHIDDYNYSNNNMGEADTDPISVLCHHVSDTTGVAASDGAYVDHIHVTWNAATGAQVYDLRRGTTPNFSEAGSLVSGVSTTELNDSWQVFPDTTYYYWVRGRNACGNLGDWSSADTGSLAPDCNGNGIPDVEDIDPTLGGMSHDCNQNGIPDECDTAEGTSTDWNNNDLPDECEDDCNGNDIMDEYELATGGTDCNNNNVLDACELMNFNHNEGSDEARYAPPITNGIAYSGSTADATIDGASDCGDSWASPDRWFRYHPAAAGSATLSLCWSDYDTVLSLHSGAPGYPENEVACNDDFCGLQSQLTFNADPQQIYYIRVAGYSGAAGDYQLTLTGPPGVRQNDCDDNGSIDECDIVEGTSPDCNQNGSPDSCDLVDGIALDCNANGTPDGCEISVGAVPDCNANGVIDECEMYDGYNSVAHDYCVQAHPLVPEQVYSGTTYNATDDGAGSCGHSYRSPAVWYYYLPAEDGETTISLCGSEYDTVLSVHTGCPGTPENEIICNDDACGLQSEVSFSASALTLYMVRVSGYSGNHGTFTLTLTGPPTLMPVSADCNENGTPDLCDINEGLVIDCDGNNIPDLCDLNAGDATDCNNNGLLDACEIADPALSQPRDYCVASQGILPGHTYYGTTIGLAPDGAATCAGDSAPSAWYFFLPAEDGSVTVSLCGSSFDTVLSVHTWCPGTIDNQLACNDDFCGAQSQVEFEAAAETLYFIRIAGRDGGAGDFQLQVTGPDAALPISPDCNENGSPDFCDMRDGLSPDCNHNDIPDGCDFLSGTAFDCNENLLLDECELADPAESEGSDLCVSAAPIAPYHVYTGSTTDATNNGASSCGITSETPDVYYYYLPITGGQALFSLCGSDYDTVLSVHSWCPGTVDNEIVCNDDTCGLQSEVFMDVTANTLYLLRISGYSGRTGQYELSVAGPPSALPVSEDCNGNLVPDTCDIDQGTSTDHNGNGIPDECEISPGDLNCDGVVNNFDIDAFVLALTDPQGYAELYPNCPPENGDINQDGVINNFDIDPFVAMLTG